MMRITEAVRDLARQVLAIEASQTHYPDNEADAEDSVYGKLRFHLVRLVGLEGFVALLARALALAKADVPGLASVEVSSTGSLTGLPEAASSQDSARVAEGYVILLAYTLGLLVLFIGDALTLSLLYEIWPDTALQDTPLGAAEEIQR